MHYHYNIWPKKNKWIKERNDSYKIYIGKFILKLHHYYECGDVLFVTVYGIFDKKELTITNIEKAKIKALELLRNELQNGIDGINDVIEDKS